MKDIMDGPIEEFALLGQQQATGVTMEQRRFQRSFQRADLSAHRGLAEIERVTGPGKTARVGDRVKYP